MALYRALYIGPYLGPFFGPYFPFVGCPILLFGVLCWGHLDNGLFRARHFLMRLLRRCSLGPSPTPSEFTQHLQNLPNNFRIYPTPSEFTQHLQDLPNTFRIYPTTSEFTQHLQHLPNTFRIYPTPSEFTHPFIIYPTPSEFTNPFRLYPPLQNLSTTFRIYPIGPFWALYRALYKALFWALFPFVGCPIFSLWAALFSLCVCLLRHQPLPNKHTR